MTRTTGTDLPELTEAAFTRQVIQLAQLLGYTVAHFMPGMSRRGRWATAMQGTVGFPDLVLVRPRVPLVRSPRILIAELKTDRGRLTAAQAKWLELFRQAGVAAFVWRPSMWAEIEATLRG